MNADDLNPKQVLLELERTHNFCDCRECQLLPAIFLSGQQIQLRDARNAARVEWHKLEEKIQELQERRERVSIAFEMLDKEFQKIPRYQSGKIKKAAMPTAGRHFENLMQKVAQVQALFDEECFIKRYQRCTRLRWRFPIDPEPSRRPAPPPEPDADPMPEVAE